jgi:hypothetical protein
MYTEKSKALRPAGLTEESADDTYIVRTTAGQALAILIRRTEAGADQLRSEILAKPARAAAKPKV